MFLIIHAVSVLANPDNFFPHPVRLYDGPLGKRLKRVCLQEIIISSSGGIKAISALPKEVQYKGAVSPIIVR